LSIFSPSFLLSALHLTHLSVIPYRQLPPERCIQIIASPFDSPFCNSLSVIAT
jgi:hypothetical protein